MQTAPELYRPEREQQRRALHPDWKIVGVAGAVAILGVGAWLLARAARRATGAPVPNPGRERDQYGALGQSLNAHPTEGPREQARRLYASRAVALETSLRRHLDRAAAMKGVVGGWSTSSDALHNPATGPDVWSQDDVWWAASQAVGETFPELDAHHDKAGWSSTMARSNITLRSGADRPETQSLAPASAWLKGAVMSRGMTLTQARSEPLDGAAVGWRFFG